MADEPRALRPASAVRARATSALQRLQPALAEHARASLGARDAAALLARVQRRFIDVYQALDEVYGATGDLDGLMADLLRLVADAAATRDDDLRVLDHRREIAPDWHLREEQVGYVCYADRFAGSLAEVADQLDYLSGLGVTYLHLMPLLRPRPSPNDGGYAVVDYRAVDPRLGDMTDLEQLAAALRGRGISLCIDLVVNHTAREHAWARRAAAGDPVYRDYYHVFGDRSLPDRYSATLPEVFPDTAPGSFTEVPGLGWVWTTFHDYQWDLNYANPRVFREMLDVMLFLANRGVEVLRLDAVPFLWKREGTACLNEPEVHSLLQAFRGLVGCAAPAVVFKAEAIVGPDELVRYLGVHDRHRPECELAYHNQLMVMGWSSAASRDVGLVTQALSQMRLPPPTTTWVTYVRCHDDIGWAVADEDAAANGLDAFTHRRFLNDFYSGSFAASFAHGALFQANPVTGDARVSGTAASLCGIEQALELDDRALLGQAVRRLLLLYGLAFSYGGIPLIYMGDEIAQVNDAAYTDDPEHTQDNRWLHRPAMDWAAAERRHDPASVAGMVFEGLRQLGAVRRGLPALRAGGDTRPLWTDDPAVFAYARIHPRKGTFLGLANFGDFATSCDAGILGAAGLRRPWDALAPDGRFGLHEGRIHLPGLGMLWLTDD